MLKSDFSLTIVSGAVDIYLRLLNQILNSGLDARPHNFRMESGSTETNRPATPDEKREYRD
jgi:hypothetical protein